MCLILIGLYTFSFFAFTSFLFISFLKTAAPSIPPLDLWISSPLPVYPLSSSSSSSSSDLHYSSPPYSFGIHQNTLLHPVVLCRRPSIHPNVAIPRSSKLG
ncbi:unnamed protein product [Cuscuta epithymum]|uniref:Uncharacterized protein n=1 Tax=Cuscuta epithymum TaxID=186058 RepID=A0AAV0C2L9_9ASTE|nr:unnamed protein product [Cuscuta epithymum]